MQFTQAHASMQMDACHTTRILQTLQQLTPRFEGVKMELPDDGKGTSKVRELVSDALKHRLAKASGKGKEGPRDITMEEGLLIQQALHSLSTEFDLITMPSATTTKLQADEVTTSIQTEIDQRADAIRSDERRVYLRRGSLHEGAASRTNDAT